MSGAMQQGQPEVAAAWVLIRDLYDGWELLGLYAGARLALDAAEANAGGSSRVRWQTNGGDYFRGVAEAGAVSYLVWREEVQR